MANYFIAGVGRALLFKGEELFADCRTLADSSITIGVTAEDIRGGEGNALFGQYYHDASFSMKLTDIMFNLDFIAANCGAEVERGVGEVFAYDTINYEGTPIELPAIAVVTGGAANIWYRSSAVAGDMVKLAPNAEGKYAFPGVGEYCIMYRKNADGRKITISSQFIPETLHAVLTVALYSGDNCNVESATKAGEVVIDIPRLQLTGAQDITMSATGAAQTALEGNALASGCTGCDGKAIYATITEVINGAHWYDDAEGLIIEDLAGMKLNDQRDVVVYAYYKDAAPKKVDLSELTLSADGTVLTYAAGKVTGAAAGNGFVKAVLAVGGKTILETAKSVVVEE